MGRVPMLSMFSNWVTAPVNNLLLLSYKYRKNTYQGNACLEMNSSETSLASSRALRNLQGLGRVTLLLIVETKITNKRTMLHSQ